MSSPESPGQPVDQGLSWPPTGELPACTAHPQAVCVGVQQGWWNCDVIVLGDAGLKKDHEVLQFLASEGRVTSLCYHRDGIDAIERRFPFLVGQSIKAHRDLIYPTPVFELSVFLGNWANAADSEKLQHLNISRIVTVHNEPGNLKFPSAPAVCFRRREACLGSQAMKVAVV